MSTGANEVCHFVCILNELGMDVRLMLVTLLGSSSHKQIEHGTHQYHTGIAHKPVFHLLKAKYTVMQDLVY